MWGWVVSLYERNRRAILHEIETPWREHTATCCIQAALEPAQDAQNGTQSATAGRDGAPGRSDEEGGL